MKIPTKNLQEKAIKKTVDGIIDVLLRMWEADERNIEFENFCIDVQMNMNAEQFAKAPTAPKKDS